jgi:predicted transcriptional regulator
MQTVTVPISVLETLIKGLQGAVDVCYNVDNKEEETEKSYPYAVGFSQSTMKWIIKDLQRLKQVPN